jgi:prefoldin beta subunit
MSTNEKSAQLARLQEQLRLILSERQKLELEIKEADRVKQEVQSLSAGIEIYKSTGPVLYKTTPEEVVQGLDSYKAELTERLELYKTQEGALKSEIERVRKSLVIQPRLDQVQTDSEEE